MNILALIVVFYSLFDLWRTFAAIKGDPLQNAHIYTDYPAQPPEFYVAARRGLIASLYFFALVDCAAFYIAITSFGE